MIRITNRTLPAQLKTTVSRPNYPHATGAEMLAGSRLAAGVVIATPDLDHVEPAVVAAEAGYHVSLEKPMATTLEGCWRLLSASERTGRHIQVCHVTVSSAASVARASRSPMFGSRLTVTCSPLPPRRRASRVG